MPGGEQPRSKGRKRERTGRQGGEQVHILLTNDDGVLSEGLQALRRFLAAQPDMFISVVAPDRERSGTGHAITVYNPLRVEEIVFPDGAAKGWAVDGTPSDCIKLAVSTLLHSRPDIVVSGINRGANLGTDVFYSGTVSAAIEGAITGIPSLAVSLTAFENLEYGLASRLTLYLVRKILQKKLPPHTLLNVNVPPLDEGSVAGVAITRLGVRRYTNTFEKRLDPRGRTYYWLSGEVADDEAAPDTDVAAIRRNEVSITPIHFDLTDHAIMAALQAWKLNMAEVGAYVRNR